MTKQKIRVDLGAPPIEKVMLAKAIVDASTSMKKLLASGLNTRAIRLLVADDSGVNQTQVKAVMESLSVLESRYCEQPKGERR